ncbi:MAG TPA: type II toxin-antitoxin system HicB family antitoxin [Tepidisphaeraceae bacterium]|nr:type II toxin-antitoxin system HicB family antitoxin [Tepidisphaeraceae bacterium]
MGKKVREVIRLIEADGWRLITQKGSHRQFVHAVKPGKVTVAGNPGIEMKAGNACEYLAPSWTQVNGRIQMRYAVVIEKATKNYSAYLPDVPGCVAAGKTVEETLSLLREAVAMHFDAMNRDGETIPDPDSLVTYFDVETPAERVSTSPQRRRPVSKAIA